MNHGELDSKENEVDFDDDLSDFQTQVSGIDSDTSEMHFDAIFIQLWFQLDIYKVKPSFEAFRDFKRTHKFHFVAFPLP